MHTRYEDNNENEEEDKWKEKENDNGMRKRRRRIQRRRRIREKEKAAADSARSGPRRRNTLSRRAHLRGDKKEIARAREQISRSMHRREPGQAINMETARKTTLDKQNTARQSAVDAKSGA